MGLWSRMPVRSFSTECAPAEKIRCVLDEYRREHFSMELPSRFRKEVVKALQGPDNLIKIDNLNVILTNIGRQDACLSAEEMNILLEASGSSDRCVSVEKILQLM